MKSHAPKKSAFELERLKYLPARPLILQSLKDLQAVERVGFKNVPLNALFPHTQGKNRLVFKRGEEFKNRKPLKVACVLSGGQASGGHNVIAALFDGLKELHPKSQVIGFLNGPGGILEGKAKEITKELLQEYRNTGGFDLIGSGRTKIETPEQLEISLNRVLEYGLDGLVIIGGDDSNTNAALLAEFFAARKCSTQVIGVPKTIDGDLKNEEIEVSFGFDTACKVYSEMIGNIARDALSSKKYTHFIKLMGRSASHIALECALQTHPNFTWIGEEVEASQKTLLGITQEMADLICRRSAAGKEYGVILIPEGLIEFIPEMKKLIKEINLILSTKTQAEVLAHLSSEAKATFSYLPEKIKTQLLLDRDPHGNVQVSHIATEELFIHLVKKELQARPTFKGKFTPVSHSFGYEGRSAFPSNFDATYCNALGLVAALLIQTGHSGYMATLSNLTAPPAEWEAGGVPLAGMMSLEMRRGKEKPVIAKALVDLKGGPFLTLQQQREKWAMEDEYVFPGPIQFSGPSILCDAPTLTLILEKKAQASV